MNVYQNTSYFFDSRIGKKKPIPFCAKIRIVVGLKCIGC